MMPTQDVSVETVRRWEGLESLELTDRTVSPFVIGRQARCIAAGCPYRRGTVEYQDFQLGLKEQEGWYARHRRCHRSPEDGCFGLPEGCENCNLEGAEHG